MARTELEQSFLRAVPTFEAIASQHEGVSGPLFLSVPAAYHDTDVRLMIVGQQTFGWESVSTGLDGLLRTYEEFDLGRSYHASPFWQAAHAVARSVNRNGTERAFLWSNLIKVDQHAARPSAEIEDAVCGLGLLNREIELMKPDAIVFFTGPRYDQRLRRTFPGVEYREVTKGVAQLEHPDLPVKSFRTYHPNYLWRSKQRELLDTIADAIAAA